MSIYERYKSLAGRLRKVGGGIDFGELVTSQLVDENGIPTGQHLIALDVDVPVIAVESTRPGHWHLYIDVALDWERYEKLLRALADAGVLEPGCFAAAERRGYTALRTPWTLKEGHETEDRKARAAEWLAGVTNNAGTS